MTTPAFTGFTSAAFDFYDDLELDNTKAYWAAHKQVWEREVRDPMTALMAQLAAEFGAAKVFRPYRDVRFAKDKTPYKDHQGAYVPTGPSTGYYAQIGSPGFMVGGGFYEAEPSRLAAFRQAIDMDHSGQLLEQLLADLEGSGFARGGDRLKTTPRGYDQSHPRIHLLRHKSLTLSKHYGFEGLGSSALVDRIRADWRQIGQVLAWITHHVG